MAIKSEKESRTRPGARKGRRPTGAAKRPSSNDAKWAKILPGRKQGTPLAAKQATQGGEAGRAASKTGHAGRGLGGEGGLVCFAGSAFLELFFNYKHLSSKSVVPDSYKEHNFL